MKTTPYWSDGVEMPKFAGPRRDFEVDVAVIGGGITGLTTAYLLKKTGATVALLERDRCGLAETGHTTAHLSCVTDSRLSELVDTFGRDHAQAAWDAGLAAIGQIHSIVKDEKIACEFAWVPAYLHAARGKENDAEEKKRLREDARLARELGFDAAYLDRVPFFDCPGVRFPNQAKFHVLQYLVALLKAIPGDGCHVFENTDASQMEGAPPVITTNGHRIRSKYVVIATHVPLQGVTGTVSAALFQTKLAPYTTYAVGAKLPVGLVPEASFWDTADPYFYLRIDRHEKHDYAILGGADHKTGQTSNPEEHYAQVEKRLRDLFPAAVIDHRWSGQVIETNDGLPYVGATAPHQFVSTGFSGNGMTFGTVAAMIACDAFHGRLNPWLSLFDVHRKKLSGAWDYLKENKDYPYYLLKQRLSAPEANSLADVQRGEGRIVVVNGAKVAAFRDGKGKLTTKSAVCPHMGCIVRWNDAEKTWDCPCHGSRFQAGGEVVTGPAETGLADLK